ncbi:MAG: glycoside hydrolase 100 family protein [Gammaproteobacteria bacterium]|nr:glycoside hydrolase 100 family protein [Gammaproteobacteria bacterium]
MDPKTALESAYQLLNDSVLCYKGNPVGTAAAVDSTVAAENYEECFVRDFVPSALVFLMDGKPEIVRNFLCLILELRNQQSVMAGHERALGLMPASFKVPCEVDVDVKPSADFGDRAIGRVAPVDSAMWWMLLLRSYVLSTGDLELAHSEIFQEGMHQTLGLYLIESFEASPAMLVPDASFMIDRRMGVYGHPLEIQALFYGMLATAQELLIHNEKNEHLLSLCKKRQQTLRSYVRIYFWLDTERLNEIHRYKSEEFGVDAVNLLNIFPESIPDWIDGWLAPETGYMLGNLGPGRMDFRFFSFGNLLSILFGLTTEQQSAQIMNLFEHRWDELFGLVPLKICYPAVTGDKWAYTTGSDPKNVPWSYHNGGNWPCLIWAFVGAAIKTGRVDLARKALNLAMEKVPDDNWPEYYDGKRGSLVGRRSNYGQVWSAAGLIIANHLLDNPDSLPVFESINF